MDGQRYRDLHGTAPGLCGKEGSGNSKGASADGAGKQGVIEAVRGGGWNVPRGWNRLPGFVVAEPC